MTPRQAAIAWLEGQDDPRADDIALRLADDPEAALFKRVREALHQSTHPEAGELYDALGNFV
jgi:hypothetical protein